MKQLTVFAGLALMCGAGPASAWWGNGHGILTQAAVRSLPPEVPAFFREGEATIAHCVQDPDVAKDRSTPNLRDAETPEHYFDAELLGDRPLPRTRYQFLKLCAEAKLDPSNVGLVPYSVTEWTERLAVAFAEHRKWPANPHVRVKCLVYAGFLAHYAQDMSQPLHCTIHHDGRAKPDGSSPRSGIHNGVDALIEKLQMEPRELARKVEPRSYTALFPAVLAQLKESRSRVERVYELEKELPPREGPWTPTPAIREFAGERAEASVRFTADLYLTAWRKSATIRLPAFLEREPAAPARAQ